MKTTVKHLLLALGSLLAELMQEDQDAERSVQLRKRMVELLGFIERYQQGSDL